MRYLLPILLALAAIATTQTAASAANIADCEKITAADAYNQCLASFGPVAHEHDLKPVPAGAGSAPIMHAQGRGSRARRYYAHYGHGHHHGRQHIEINVGGSD